jgi:hypothetical protein
MSWWADELFKEDGDDDDDEDDDDDDDDVTKPAFRGWKFSMWLRTEWVLVVLPTMAWLTDPAQISIH